MTPLWFNISHTRRSFSNTSTQWILPCNSLWKKLDLMVSYHFWLFVNPQTDGTFTTKSILKPTHTDLYLQ